MSEQQAKCAWTLSAPCGCVICHQHLPTEDPIERLRAAHVRHACEIAAIQAEARQGLPVVPVTGGGEPPLHKAPALFDGERADLLHRIDALKDSRNNVHWITIAPLLLQDIAYYLRQQATDEAQSCVEPKAVGKTDEVDAGTVPSA